MEDLDAVAAHESRELNEVVERLMEGFPGVREALIRSAVEQAHERFAGNPIRDFVPVFVERAARDQLSRSVPGTPDNG